MMALTSINRVRRPATRAAVWTMARTFAAWLALTAGWVFTSPTGIALRQMLDH